MAIVSIKWSSFTHTNPLKCEPSGVYFHSTLTQPCERVSPSVQLSVHHTPPRLLCSCHEFPFLMDWYMLQRNDSIFSFAYLALTSVQTFCRRWKMVPTNTASMTAIIAFQKKRMWRKWKLPLGIGSIFYSIHYFKIGGFPNHLYCETNTIFWAEAMEEYKTHILI